MSLLLERIFPPIILLRAKKENFTLSSSVNENLVISLSVIGKGFFLYLIFENKVSLILCLTLHFRILRQKKLFLSLRYIISINE